MPITITPYEPAFDSSIGLLENTIVQGKGIQLRILKDHFLQRSAVFPKTFPALAVNEHKQVIGTSIGAQTNIKINGEEFAAGFVFDAKVHKDYRNQGIGRSLAEIQKKWFTEEGWAKNITALKSSNIPVLKLSAKGIGHTWLTKFVYLTIPTSAHLENRSTKSTNRLLFNVSLFDEEKLSSQYFTRFKGGLGIFHTWQLYQLKIERVSWIYHEAIRLLKTSKPERYKHLPDVGNVMEFATLFDHTEDNLHLISEVLNYLHNQEKKFLLVCCQKNDSVYRYLRKYSINTYDYYLMSDFPITKEDSIVIDVRCL